MSGPRQHAIERPDGTQIAYEAYGPETAARTVVLVHGLAAAGAQFAADALAFAARGDRVLVPDLRGHGRSTRPGAAKPVPVDFTIARMAEDMAALLEHAASGPVHWVGNSLGGILGLHLLALSPARFASFASFGTAHALDLPAIAATGFALPHRVLGARLCGAITARFTTDTVAARPLVARLIARFDPGVGTAIAHNVRRYDLREAALGFDGPMLLIEGGKDHLVNRALRRTLPQMLGKPGFRHVRLAQGGHCANLDATELWRETLIGFWDAAERSRRAPSEQAPIGEPDQREDEAHRDDGWRPART